MGKVHETPASFFDACNDPHAKRTVIEVRGRPVAMVESKGMSFFKMESPPSMDTPFIKTETETVPGRSRAANRFEEVAARERCSPGTFLQSMDEA